MSSSLEIRSNASESDYSDDSDTESENVGTLAYTRSDNTWLRDVEEAERAAQTSTQELPQQDGSTEQAVHQDLSEQIVQALKALSVRVDASMHERRARVDEMENKETQLQVANDMIKRLRQQLTQESKKLQELNVTKVELQNKNELLEERSHALAMERSFRQHLEAQAAKPPNRTLAVGSSLVRDLDEKLYGNTKVVSISGGIPKDVTNVLNSHGHTRFSKVILVVRGNQVNENMDNKEEVTSDMREAVLVAKTMAPSVAVCELPPRLNSENASKS